MREHESLICLLEPLRPPSRGILDRPGGKPDGVEQGWEFRE